MGGKPHKYIKRHCIFCGEWVPEEQWVERRGDKYRRYFHTECFNKEYKTCKNSKPEQ